MKRIPAPKFQEWKDIETQVLALKEKPGSMIRPYVAAWTMALHASTRAFQLKRW